jgi:alpha-galactosidase
MNRPLSETGAENLECPQELWLRHTQAVYNIVDRLKEKHPDVAIESCSSGGGRSDYGALLHFDQVWTSDNTDSVDRMTMQKWFTYLRPTKVMRAWVTDINWYNSPMSLDFRFNVAMQGSLGVGGNLTKYSREDLEVGKKNVALYKEIRHLVQFGDLYRILDAQKDEILFNLYVSEDKTEAVAFLASLTTSFMKKEIPLLFEGLDDNKVYTFNLNNRDYEKTGAYLKNVGIPVTIRGMGYNKVIKIKAK